MGTSTNPFDSKAPMSTVLPTIRIKAGSPLVSGHSDAIDGANQAIVAGIDGGAGGVEISKDSLQHCYWQDQDNRGSLVVAGSDCFLSCFVSHGAGARRLIRRH